jgi:hypothetical protein
VHDMFGSHIFEGFYEDLGHQNTAAGLSQCQLGFGVLTPEFLCGRRDVSVIVGDILKAIM